MQVSFILVAASIDEIKVAVVLAPVAEGGGIGVNRLVKSLDSHVKLESAAPVEPVRVIFESIKILMMSVRIIGGQQTPLAVNADELEVFMDQPVFTSVSHFERRVAGAYKMPRAAERRSEGHARAHGFHPGLPDQVKAVR